MVCLPLSSLSISTYYSSLSFRVGVGASFTFKGFTFKSAAYGVMHYLSIFYGASVTLLNCRTDGLSLDVEFYSNLNAPHIVMVNNYVCYAQRGSFIYIPSATIVSMPDYMALSADGSRIEAPASTITTSGGFRVWNHGFLSLRGASTIHLLTGLRGAVVVRFLSSMFIF
jgi:hypothetical protein